MSWKALFTRNMNELRFLLAQTSQGSKGARYSFYTHLCRDFINQNYGEIKMLNPTFPFLVRECEGIKARVIARYDFGEEREMDLENFSVDEVTHTIAQLVKIGDTMPRSAESNWKDFREDPVV